MSTVSGEPVLHGAGRPLDGVRVLELGPGVAVRYCGRLLHQLGAEVVRFDEELDDDRIGGSGAAGRAYGAWLDAGKHRSASPRGRFDLVVAGQDADTITAAGRVLEELDGEPTLLEIRWFSPDGPYADWPAADEVVLALCGLAYAFGEATGPPTLAQGHTPQVLTGANACGMALAAVLAPPGRRPRHIQVEVFESTVCLSETGAVAHHANARAVSARVGVNRFVPTYPASSYRTRDGWVGVTCLTPAQWAALCEAIDRPDLATEPAFSTAYRRLRNADDVDAALGDAFAERTTDAWVAEGLAKRIPITAMPTPAELPQVPQWRARGSFAEVDSAGVTAPTLPFRWRADGHIEGRWEPDPAVPGPLSGLRVVDLTMGWAGPLATRTLADLGADVVKIESEQRPDWWRGWEATTDADPPTIEIQTQFNATNRNKRGIALDLRSPEGREAALALIERADVVIENFAAGVCDQLGLGAEVLRRHRPGLVFVSMPAFGADGPLAGIRAYGSTVEQASGLPFVNGRTEWPPSLQHVAFGDPVAGVYGVIAVLAALVGRPVLGGADVDLAQVACLFELGADAIVAVQVNGDLGRTGNRRARLAPCCVVPCAGDDEWLAVAVHTESAWQGLCAALGASDWLADASLATVSHRNDVADELEATIAAWAASRAVADAAAHLRAHGVAAAPVQPAHALGSDPHLVATGAWQELDRRYVGLHLLGAPAVRLDGQRPAPRRAAPTLGQHTAEVLSDPRWRGRGRR